MRVGLAWVQDANGLAQQWLLLLHGFRLRMIVLVLKRMVIQVLGLCSLGIQAISLSSLTPKEEITAAYKQMDSDSDIRFVYGAPSTCPTGSS